MRVLIIEDEPQAAARLTSLVQELQPSWSIVATLDSVKRSVAWLKQNACDLILMDIQLADGLSFEVFDQVEVKTPVIFTTAYNEYALKAFKVNSIDYLLKPIDKDELVMALKKYSSLTGKLPVQDKMIESIGLAMQMLTKKYKERFVIKVGEHLKSIEVGEILFFFSLEKTTFAQTADGRKHILDFTLDQLDGLLDLDRFFRINRKYMVSVHAIKDMITYTNSRLKLILKTSDDDDVIVARERVQDFKNWLDR
ncbi:MAG TPA: LytTR family DNA-binding domain-containing protein [Cyclobacteriaceae bacterium]|jgi:DNA-binding LytR/AlgR family response regulator|nr:response regulator transcription factor [Cytophagales bacterium]HNT50145.1 LytTR family DNA-binding domain-containing protein [Cyclobacteriaceae bacterium]